MHKNSYPILFSLLLIPWHTQAWRNPRVLRSLLTQRSYHTSRPAHRPLTEDNTRLTVSPEESSAPDLIRSINELPSGGLVLLDGSSISHNGVIEALQMAAQRGVRIEACVDTKRPENKALASIPEIKIHKRDIHTKRTLLFPIDPESGEIDGTVFFGSENMSNNAGRHIEVHLQSTAPICVHKHFKDHELNIKDKDQNEPDYSDEDLRILNSRQHNLNNIIAAHIESPSTVCIKLATMVLTDEAIWNALAAQARAGKAVQIIVDENTWKYPNGKHFIPELLKHGADVRSYGRAGRFQHAKIVSLEQLGEYESWQLGHKKTLDMISSANCTRMGNQQINSTMVVCNNPWFHGEIETTLGKIANLCTPLH
jgi:hypothetical protein